ncbi:putative transcriptional regulator (plasmid) [Variovorax sp. PBS-H4]|nr:putative transcriptional regulator [Variovorax sp. PBS-H4]
MLGVGRARAGQLVRQPDFPPPAAQLSNGSVWNLTDILAWAGARTHARDLDLSVLDDIPELSGDPGRLVGRREVELLIGRSKTQVNRLLEAHDFPQPLARLGAGSVWALPAVQAWAAAAGRELNLDVLEQEQT